MGVRCVRCGMLRQERGEVVRRVMFLPVQEFMKESGAAVGKVKEERKKNHSDEFREEGKSSCAGKEEVRGNRFPAWKWKEEVQLQ